MFSILVEYSVIDVSIIVHIKKCFLVYSNITYLLNNVLLIQIFIKGLFVISPNSLNPFTPSLEDPIINIKSLANASLFHLEIALMKNLTTGILSFK